MKLEETDKVKELLKISKSDLESAEILFNHKQYSNAVSCFQQSVEKSMKAYSVINELVPFSELKTQINHNPLKLYSKSAEENISKSKKLSSSLELNPQLKEISLFKKIDLDDFEKGNKRVSSIISKVNKDLILSEDMNELNTAILEMKDLIKELSKYKKIVTPSDEEIKNLKNLWIANVAPIIETKRKQGENISGDWEREITSIPDANLIEMITYYQNLILLGGVSHTLNFILNLLLKPHFDFVRYPEKKNPLEYYTLSNPLIKKFSELLSIQGENLCVHNKYLEFILNDKKI